MLRDQAHSTREKERESMVKKKKELKLDSIWRGTEGGEPIDRRCGLVLIRVFLFGN